MTESEESPELLAARERVRLAVRLFKDEWRLEAEPLLEEETTPEVPEPVAEPVQEMTASRPASVPAVLFPKQVLESATPPHPDRIIEAMLFVGAEPLSPELVAETVRGFNPNHYRATIERLNSLYRRQNRPYTIRATREGDVLALRSQFREVKERLQGIEGPREWKFSQAAIEVLSVIAYRPESTRAELDTLRGAESTAELRKLLKQGLLSVTGDRKSPGYLVTQKFWELFGLSGPNDLPKLTEPAIGDEMC